MTLTPYERALEVCSMLDSLLESIEKDSVKEDYGKEGAKFVIEESKAQIGILVELVGGR